MKANWLLKPFVPPGGEPVWIGASGMLSDGRFDMRRLSRPCVDAGTVGILSKALVGRHVDERMHVDADGAYVHLLPQASLFHHGSSDLREFMRRLEDLGGWLQRWRDAAQEGHGFHVECPAWALDFGRRELEDLVLGMACKKQRCLTIGLSLREYVSLVIPPRAELVRPPTCTDEEDRPPYERVTGIEAYVELVNKGGLACLVDASRVDPRVCTGMKTRLVRLRRVPSTPWHKAMALERIGLEQLRREGKSHENA